MTLTEGKKLLRATLLEALAEFGFDEQKELIYTKAIIDGPIWKLAFPCRLDQNKSLKINCHVGISYKVVESILRPENLNSGEVIATIMKPIHSLRPDGRFREWVLESADECKKVGREIIADIDAFALPFLNRYADINVVESELQKDDPSCWFILDPEQRIATLAAITASKGDYASAQSMIQIALAERANDLPKKRRLLEQGRLGRGQSTDF